MSQLLPICRSIIAANAGIKLTQWKLRMQTRGLSGMSSGGPIATLGTDASWLPAQSCGTAF